MKKLIILKIDDGYVVSDALDEKTIVTASTFPELVYHLRCLLNADYNEILVLK